MGHYIPWFKTLFQRTLCEPLYLVEQFATSLKTCRGSLYAVVEDCVLRHFTLLTNSSSENVPDPYVTPSFWNSLPREIRHIQSTTAFKTAPEDSSVQILPLLAKSLSSTFFCKLFQLTCRGVCVCVRVDGWWVGVGIM